MKVTLGTNIAALTAQGQLGKVGQQLSSTFERLSTGLRINGPGDDPAGLAMADKLALDTEIFSQGIRNLNEGISLFNVADSALDQLSKITTRILELAEQSSNEIYSYDQRRALDHEAQELSSEFTRIVQSTEYNGTGLLNGGMGNGVTLQAGYGSDGSITGSIGGAVGTGEFEAASNFVAGGGGVIWSVEAGDLNGDGILDLVVQDEPNFGVYIRLGNGDGTFQPSAGALPISSEGTIALQDFNNDGILDIAVADGAANNVNIMINNGNAAFSSAGSYLFGDDPRISYGDFNGDGNVDVVAANYAAGENTLSVRLGNGDGTLRSESTYFLGPGVQAADITVGDFNGDGILDLATPHLADDEVGIFLGVGDGTFGAVTPYSTGGASQPNGIIDGDFNGDGILDLAVSSDEGSVRILLGIGDGSFATGVSYTSGDAPRDIETGDFNGDGILDLATASYNESSVTILLGRGDGTFGANTEFSVNGGPQSVAIGDFTSDGVLDLVTANYAGGAGTVSLLEGSTVDGTAGLLPFSLLHQGDARIAVSMMKDKVKLLSEQRGELGAFQSRISATVGTLRALSVETEIAEGRIRDADIAKEASDLIRLQILQQAATAMLAQANESKSVVLQLLEE